MRHELRDGRAQTISREPPSKSQHSVLILASFSWHLAKITTHTPTNLSVLTLFSYFRCIRIFHPTETAAGRECACNRKRGGSTRREGPERAREGRWRKQMRDQRRTKPECQEFYFRQLYVLPRSITEAANASYFRFTAVCSSSSSAHL